MAALNAESYDRFVDELMSPSEAALLRSMVRRSQSSLRSLLSKAVAAGLLPALDSEERLCAHREADRRLERPREAERACPPAARRRQTR